VVWENDPNRSHNTGTGCAVTWSEVWNQQSSASPTASATASSCSAIAATFSVTATTVWGQNVYVVGGIAALGSWNTANAIALSSAAYPVWSATVSLPTGTSFEYKYIKKDGSGAVVWESDPNRSRTTPTSPCTAAYSDTWR
jgi:alpha-amylase